MTCVCPAKQRIDSALKLRDHVWAAAGYSPVEVEAVAKAKKGKDKGNNKAKATAAPDDRLSAEERAVNKLYDDLGVTRSKRFAHMQNFTYGL